MSRDDKWRSPLPWNQHYSNQGTYRLEGVLRQWELQPSLKTFGISPRSSWTRLVTTKISPHRSTVRHQIALNDAPMTSITSSPPSYNRSTLKRVHNQPRTESCSLAADGISKAYQSPRSRKIWYDLTVFLNLSLKTLVIPNIWKVGTIIPILMLSEKPNNQGNSYKPESHFFHWSPSYQKNESYLLLIII